MIFGCLGVLGIIYCKKVFGSDFVKFESLPISHCWNPNQQNIPCSRSWMWVPGGTPGWCLWCLRWSLDPPGKAWNRGVVKRCVDSRKDTHLLGFKCSSCCLSSFLWISNIQLYKYNKTQAKIFIYCANSMMTIFSMKPANSGILAWQSDQFVMLQDSEVPRPAVVASAEKKSPSTIFGLGHLTREMFDPFCCLRL